MRRVAIVKKNDETAPATPATPFGVYVHVPFCGTACDYCAFYHVPPTRDAVVAWLGGIERELALVPFPRRADTFFLGGGTPGVLSAKNFDRLSQLLLDANGGVVPAEWTVELAPATATREKLLVLRERGVSRISLGVQSFDAETLSILGRRHSPKQIFSAIEKIRSAGFDNLNFDLIFSVPGEKPARWEADLETALALAPEHLSAYCLILEENAPLLARLKKSGKFDPREKSPAREAEIYLATWEKLAAAGYAQYEVANHAKPGRACLHNLHTWQMGEWLGYGPAAASQCGGRRFSNPENLALWLKKLSEGVPAHEVEKILSARQLFEDAIVFGLRLAGGFDLAELERKFGVPAPRALADFARDLRKEGYLADAGTAEHFWRPTRRGLLVADAIALRVLELFD